MMEIYEMQKKSVNDLTSLTLVKQKDEIVLKSNTIPKIFSFCDDKNHYLFNASMFQKFNNGQGINRALEKDLFSYLLNYLHLTSNVYNFKMETITK